jgi:hypothetical protein
LGLLPLVGVAAAPGLRDVGRQAVDLLAKGGCFVEIGREHGVDSIRKSKDV